MASTLLSYSIQPPQVFIGTQTSLTLVVQNSLTSGPITFKGGPNGDEIDVTFRAGSGDADLVTALDFTVGSVTPGNFTCGKSAATNQFILKAPAGATLNPGDQILVAFTGVTINPRTGTSPVGIKEYIGAGDGDASVLVQKLPQSLGIIAWLQPQVVGMYQPSTLYWQSMGGTSVQIAGFNDGTGTKSFPVMGQPPYPGNCPVAVLPTESQRTYTVTVFTSDGQHTQVPVTVTQHAPVITSFTSDKSGTLGVNDVVNLSWSSIFGSSSMLKPPGFAIQNPISPRQVTPGLDLAAAYASNYGAMPASADYTLTVFGYQQNQSSSLAFQLSPVGLNYFKYANKAPDGTLSGIRWATDPSNWPPVLLAFNGSNLNTLTIYQPGGTTNVYYLGSGDTVHPQIQYFNCEKGDGLSTISWVTANLSSLTLNPGGYQIAVDQIVNGSQQLSLTADQYILTGVGNNGETIISRLDVSKLRIQAALAPSFGEAFNDPNCTITIAATGAINNYLAPTAANVRDASNAIAQLTFADIWRLPPFRINSGTVRLDVQGAVPGGGRNWQVQVNGVNGHSTCSAIIVQGNLVTASTAERQAYVQRMVRNALVISLNTAQSQNVNGPCH